MENKNHRVLIVDDMNINRIVLSSLLATHGVFSDQAESGKECLELCKKNDYDLILLDHRMPELDGAETLIRLKEIFSARGRDIPVICHTTEEGRKNISLYKAAGFADVLIKPIDPRELFSVLMTWLNDGTVSDDSDEELSFDKVAAAYPGFDDMGLTDNDTGDELEKLPVWLKIVPHIDLITGVKNCGSAEDYVDALYIFYSSIEEKSNEIESYASGEDWTMYALRVHSIKSVARLVGAKKLGDAAAELEEASRAEKYNFVRKNTGAFLRSYREFTELLSPFAENDELEKILREASSADKETDKPSDEPDHGNAVLFIQSGQGLVKKGIENNLTSAGFNVISIPDEPDRIISHRNEADLVIYYPGSGDDPHIGIIMSLLGEICQDDSKILCLTGDVADLNTAMLANGSHRVSRCYPRPVPIDQFIGDMKSFADLEKDFHRKKTIFVVDDDTSYMSVIEHWLSGQYNVSCFRSGPEALDGILAVMPDLILLDFEMPEMDGCELMKNLRTNFEHKIPIIFLTGKNDKELVFHVLEYKPDGYLLKTSQRDTLLDTIQRFFSETLFRMSLSQNTADNP